MEDDLFSKIQKAIVELDEENLAQLTEQVTRQGIDPVEAIEETYTVCIHKVGDLFAAGEFFCQNLLRGVPMCCTDTLPRAL